MTGNSQATNSNVSTTEKPDTQHDAVIMLDECLGISEAAKLYSHLMELASRGHDVILDSSKVSVIDTTVLQMLVSFVWQTNQSGSKVAWQHPSEAFCKSARLLGLESHLGMETNAA